MVAVYNAVHDSPIGKRQSMFPARKYFFGMVFGMREVVTVTDTG